MTMRKSNDCLGYDKRFLICYYVIVLSVDRTAGWWNKNKEQMY